MNRKTQVVLLTLMLFPALLFADSSVASKKAKEMTMPLYYSYIFQQYRSKRFSTARTDVLKNLNLYFKSHDALWRKKSTSISPNDFLYLNKIDKTLKVALACEYNYGDGKVPTDYFKLAEKYRLEYKKCFALFTATKAGSSLKTVRQRDQFQIDFKSFRISEIAIHQWLGKTHLKETKALIGYYKSEYKETTAFVQNEVKKISNKWTKNKEAWKKSVIRWRKRIQMQKEQEWGKIEEKKENKRKEAERKFAPYTREPIVYTLIGILIILLVLRFKKSQNKQ